MHSDPAHTKFMAHEHCVPAASSKEVVINYHLTQLCNYRCKYCYAQWSIQSPKDELHHDPEQVQRLLKVLHREFLPQVPHRRTGTSLSRHSLRLNLVGGEPFLVKHFGEIIEAAQTIGFKVSIVTNGSLLNEEFILKYARTLFMVGFSVDAVEEDRLLKIGRCTASGETLKAAELERRIRLMRAVNPLVQIKINTVVSRDNFDCDMRSFIQRVGPDKWKVLRVLPNLRPCCGITDGQYQRFVETHRWASPVMCTEDNADMIGSYVMVDPLGRFFDNTWSLRERGYRYSAPILEVGALKAFEMTNVAMDKFWARYERPGKLQSLQAAL